MPLGEAIDMPSEAEVLYIYHHGVFMLPAALGWGRSASLASNH